MAVWMMSASALVIGLLSAASASLLAWSLRLRQMLWRQRHEQAETTPGDEERRAADGLARSHVRLREKWRILQTRADATERELSTLVYSVSHDLRAPLRGIDGFSQALLEDYGSALDPNAQDYLRRVRANAVQMSGLIDDLLSLAAVARAPFRRESVDVSALARRIAIDLARTDTSRPVRWDIPSNIQAVADRPLLTEALRQLLENAWKFTAARDVANVSLRVLAAESDRGGGAIYQVSDNGAGFDMQYAGKLFGAFQRMHTPEEFPGGRGIGLALVQRIVQRHGGRLWAEAVAGQGATFSFTLEPATADLGADDLSAVGAVALLPTGPDAADATLSTTNAA